MSDEIDKKNIDPTDKLEICIQALKEISKWDQDHQNDTVAKGLLLMQWRGCIGIANSALYKIGIEIE